MKTQMRLQKILMLSCLIVGALTVVYALIFCSGVFSQLALEPDFSKSIKKVFDLAQSFSDTFLILGIIYVLTAVLLYVMGCQSRRNYYITNYVAVGIFVLYAVIYAVLLIAYIAPIQSALAAISAEDWEDYAFSYEMNMFEGTYGKLQTTSWTIPLGYVLMVICLLSAVAQSLNLVWKIKLMQGEKKLLGGAQKEATLNEEAV